MMQCAHSTCILTIYAVILYEGKSNEVFSKKPLFGRGLEKNRSWLTEFSENVWKRFENLQKKHHFNQPEKLAASN